MDVYPSMNYIGSSLSQQIYQSQFDAIRKLQETGDCVIVGRGADYVLRDYSRLVTVFIQAGINKRAARVAEYEKISPDKAKDMIIKADKKRANFYNFQTEKKWGAASSYQLTLDSGAIGYEGAVEIIKDFVALRKRQWAEEGK